MDTVVEVSLEAEDSKRVESHEVQNVPQTDETSAEIVGDVEKEVATEAEAEAEVEVAVEESTAETEALDGCVEGDWVHVDDSVSDGEGDGVLVGHPSDPEIVPLPPLVEAVVDKAANILAAKVGDFYDDVSAMVSLAERLKVNLRTELQDMPRDALLICRYTFHMCDESYDTKIGSGRYRITFLLDPDPSIKTQMTLSRGLRARIHYGPPAPISELISVTKLLSILQGSYKSLYSTITSYLPTLPSLPSHQPLKDYLLSFFYGNTDPDTSHNGGDVPESSTALYRDPDAVHLPDELVSSILSGAGESSLSSSDDDE